MDAASKSQTADVVHNFLTTRLKLTPLSAFAALLVIGLLDELLIGYLTGNWDSTRQVVGAREDYPHWIVAFFFQPAVWAFYLWLAPAAEKIFNLIEANAIPDQHIAAYRQSKDDFFKIIRAPWISWLSLVLGVLLVVLSLYFTSRYVRVPWTYAVVWHRYSIWSLRLLAVGYFFSFSVIASILIMIKLNNVFTQYGVKIHLYHGDNVAGLKFIGDFAVRLNQLALISLSFLVSDLLLALQVGKGIRGQPNLIMEIIAFPTVILFSFFAPLISCRRAMIAAKITELDLKAAQIRDQLKLVEKAPAADKSQIEGVSALINLRKQLSSDIPTLPIDITALRAFSVSFTISLIPALISVVLEVISFFR